MGKVIWILTCQGQLVKNNHHSEPSEVELNGSLTTAELKKPHPSRLIGVAEMWNRLGPNPCMVDQI